MIGSHQEIPRPGQHPAIAARTKLDEPTETIADHPSPSSLSADRAVSFLRLGWQAGRFAWRACTFQWRAIAEERAFWRRLRHDEGLLAADAIFNAAYYRRNHMRSGARGLSPERHYLLVGCYGQSDPHPLFDGAWYRETYLRGRAAGDAPVLHYVRIGRAAGAKPNAYFDPAWYREQNAAFLPAGCDPVEHYLTEGAAAGLDPSPAFRTRSYLEHNPDVLASGINPLEHYMRRGRREGRLADAKVIASAPPVTDTPIACLKNPPLRSEVGLFVTHSPDGRLKAHVPHYLDSLMRAGIGVTLIVAADRGFDEADAALRDRLDGLYVRANEGWDFACWAHVMRLNPHIRDADIVYWLNDSLLGPVSQESLDRVLHRIRGEDAALVGLTANHERRRHLQSFFLAFKREALHSSVFRQVLEGIRSLPEKEDVINAYEISLSSTLDAAGLKTVALFEPKSRTNETIYEWKKLLESGFPFLKVMVITGDTPGVDRNGWRDALRSKGYDVAIADRMLAERVEFTPPGVTPTQSIHTACTEEAYDDWAEAHESRIAENREAIIGSIQKLRHLPLFSILLLPEADDDTAKTDGFVEAIRGQLYPYWELILPGGRHVAGGKRDDRIRVLGHGGMPAEDTRHAVRLAVEAAEGEFILPLPADARLAEDALLELARAVDRDPQAELLYGDEDRIDASGTRSAPRFKTAWDPDLALARDALGTPTAYRTELLRSLEAAPLRHRGAALVQRELSLRAAFSAAPAHIHHVPAILCHRLASLEASPSWDAEAARDLVRAHLAEEGRRAEVIAAPRMPAWNWIRHALPEPPPLVSIIVPTRDRADLVERCAESILFQTDYPAIELLIIDNDSRDPTATALLARLARLDRVRILPHPGPFNYSAMNNRAAREARGAVLVLLNNDTAAIRRDWLRDMVAHALRPDVGAVGARLLYEGGRVQHAGLVFQPDVAPVHQFRFADHGETGPGGELVLARSVSMVTGACLALRRSLFLQAGGLDEKLRVAFNDVDLCMRLGDLGYRIVWTPVAELFHFESASRGFEDTPEKQALAARELVYFRSRWGSLMREDPFHNGNVVQNWDTVTLAAPRPVSP